MKTIFMNEYIFTDWDEIYGHSLLKVKNNPFVKIQENEDIHLLLDGGFTQNTKLILFDGREKYIQNIQIGDILKNGETVYGTVEIDATDIRLYEYDFNCTYFQGGPNLAIYDNKGSKINTTLEFNKNKNILNLNQEKQFKLFHLLTNSNNFQVGNILFRDYNGCLDFINC